MPTPSTAAPMAPIDWLMLVVLSVLWGGSFLFNAVAVAEVPPLTLVMLRTAIGAAVLLAVTALSGHRMPTDGATWGAFVVLGLLGNLIPFSLIAFGQTAITAGLAAILNATTPLFTVLVLYALRGERIGWLKGAGIVLGIAGVAILLAPKLAVGEQARLVGALAVLGGSLSYGFSGTWATRFRHLPPSVTSAGGLTATAVLAAPLALWLDRPWILRPSAEAMAAVAAIGTVSTGLAYLLFYRILNRAGPTNASTVTFLVPVSAILLGALVLGERLDWTAFAGMAVIFAGLAAIDGRPLRHLAKVRTTARVD